MGYWEDSVPGDLILAVTHLRKLFHNAHWRCGQATQKFAYASIRNEEIDDPAKEHFKCLMRMKARVGRPATQRFYRLLKQGTPCASFKAFFDLYIDGMTVEILEILQELTDIALAGRERLTESPLQWAEAQAQHMIRSHIDLIPDWVRGACDVHAYDPEEDYEVLFPRWRAPKFLVMSPCWEEPYEPDEAWERMNRDVSSQWLVDFAGDYVRRLETHVQRALGPVALDLAKQPVEMSEPASGQAAQRGDGGSSPKRNAMTLRTQARYAAWQMECRKLRKRRPGMSDVWYSQQIAKLPIAEGHRAETIRKHMNK